MYIFQYLSSPSPLMVISSTFDQIDIINVFMLINDISAHLMTAMYAAADQDLDTVLQLQDYFLRMWDLYNRNPSEEHQGIFGTYYAYHLHTRTLRRIDMSIVDNHTRRANTTQFVPNQLSWRRAREVRTLYRTGQYRVADEFDLAELQMAWYGGLRIRRGRHNHQS